MPSNNSTNALGIFLEAEVAPNSQAKFQSRYLTATSHSITPGTPASYQSQPNKWGTELRVYFNDPALAKALGASGLNVEVGRRGYKSGEYAYRVNKNSFWWKLVESEGLRLGLN